MGTHRHHSYVAICSLVAVTAIMCLISMPKAYALPIFARKYNTSCLTCHTVFAGMTPFGDAFRRNGYRFPGDDDEDNTVSDPIALGQDAQRDMFPNEVWPGIAPAQVPVTAFFELGGGVGRQDAPSGGTQWATHFESPTFGVATAGNYGRHFSWWGIAEFNEEEGLGVENPHVIITPFDTPELNIMIGQFQPPVEGFSVHRDAMGHGTMPFEMRSLADNEFNAHEGQLGIGFNGTIAHRLGYATGILEGSRDVRQKDVYARLEYKIGGMSLDGTQPTGYDRPWQEVSALVGGAFYRGTSSLDGTDHEDFWRANADVTLNLVNATIMLAGFRQHDAHPIVGAPESGDLTGAMGSLSYVIYPWFIPTVRYTIFQQSISGTPSVTMHRMDAGIAMLMRANIAIRVNMVAMKDPGDSFALDSVNLGLNTAF